MSQTALRPIHTPRPARRAVRPLGALFAGLVCIATLACGANPPVHWNEGGATLLLPEANWARNDEGDIRLRRDGRVLVDGDLWLTLDSAGRVFDADREPLALLETNGHLAGNEQEHLGRIGLHNASPPWTNVAWLRVARDGTVVAFGSDAEPVHLGTWRGCNGPAVRACTLVSHLVLLDSLRGYGPPMPPPTMQPGIGLGFWY
jgi:hypothetical protein